MAAGTFTTALFLIAAVIATGVLILAIVPVISSKAGAFGFPAHTTEPD